MDDNGRVGRIPGTRVRINGISVSFVFRRLGHAVLARFTVDGDVTICVLLPAAQPRLRPTRNSLIQALTSMPYPQFHHRLVVYAKYTALYPKEPPPHTSHPEEQPLLVAILIRARPCKPRPRRCRHLPWSPKRARITAATLVTHQNAHGSVLDTHD